MAASDAEWLAGLKSGDQVAVSNAADDRWVSTVAAVSDRLVVVGTARYRRVDGRGGSKGTLRISPPTTQELDDYRRGEAIDRIRDLCENYVPSVPTSRIEAALALLTSPEGT